jgi:zinc transporter ZupT
MNQDRADRLALGSSLSLLIAGSIGVHNFGEGLAIAASYSLGLIAFTSLLIVGFAIHNATEGLAIVAALGDASTGLPTLAFLGLVAGVPTIAGAWLGAFAYGPLVSLVFLGLGVGRSARSCGSWLGCCVGAVSHPRRSPEVSRASVRCI